MTVGARVGSTTTAGCSKSAASAAVLASPAVCLVLSVDWGTGSLAFSLAFCRTDSATAIPLFCPPEVHEPGDEHEHRPAHRVVPQVAPTGAVQLHVVAAVAGQQRQAGQLH